MLLMRQKTVLNLLTQAGHPLSPTVFVKLVFLLRHETVVRQDPSFYDFLPYKYGPFSFTLYRELAALRQEGHVAPDENTIALSELTHDPADRQATEPAMLVQAAVTDVLRRYGSMHQNSLVHSVYTRYPWYALNSELPERNLASVERPRKASPAVYTVGYEGKSVDAFFNDLIKRGIEIVVDVRANPVSRKYGFSRLRLGEICKRLGLEYRHVPSLGIPGSARADLSDYDSYQRLLDHYEHTVLPIHPVETRELGALMRKHPAALLCVEKDVRCCHRSRLASAAAKAADLEIVHL